MPWSEAGTGRWAAELSLLELSSNNLHLLILARAAPSRAVRGGGPHSPQGGPSPMDGSCSAQMGDHPAPSAPGSPVWVQSTAPQGFGWAPVSTSPCPSHWFD